MDNFGAAFHRLIGFPPMSWQERLYRRFLCGDGVCGDQGFSHVDLPTGLGKTSVMAIWYLARKAGAALPRRLIYVVDRRAVVDQATTAADEIKLKSGDDRLRVSTLRGQHADNRAWLEDPAAPAIIVGTVDMIGSRLLFCGYGVSRKMRPYHAGLLGADALVVLDESHLVPPFQRLLEAIESGTGVLGPRQADDRTVVPAFRLLCLSATGRKGGQKPFALTGADLRDPVVAHRLWARKRLALVEADPRKPEDALAREAWALSAEGTKATRCVVYCDSRQTAVKTKAAIEKLARDSKVAVSAHLLVGARRLREREDAAAMLTALGFLPGGAPAPTMPVFLIATSAGEVGVDLDADHMVCDLVPWERLVQRLGRVNRRGNGDATVILVHGGEPPSPKTPDSPKPDERRALIAWHARRLLDELPVDGDGIDVSPGALRQLSLRAAGDPDLDQRIRQATTPAPLHPPLTRALVDAWAMTSLPAHTGRPEVGPWLRGWVDDEPQTVVVWRRHLPVRIEGGSATEQEIADFFEAAPPHASEMLETETRRVAEWLAARAAAVTGGRSSSLLAATDIVAFALEPSGDLRHTYSLDRLNGGADARRQKDRLVRDLAGATLVVDARLGGLSVDGLLDERTTAEPRTADDGGDSLELTEHGHPAVRFRVTPMPADAAGKVGTPAVHSFVTRRSEDGEDIDLLIIETWTTEESRAASIRPQLLAEHRSWTERQAVAIADGVGLTGELKDTLAIAARLHDEGKSASRWQQAFNAPGKEAYAKTKGPLKLRRLDGYRHEFGSLAHAEADAAFRALPADLQDLVLHLIAAHHGRARPLIETSGSEDAPPSILEGRARDVALRFARLQKRWGPWGLAWWEALLRAADQQASRANDDRARADGAG
ncbi:MAG: type I-U CRISPR-associated helicase/endonuclease Cas3 [Rhodospirillaceae bacterium]|nr:type I-U CRISPR-associated helicase/endonuclease Cas3 [Rhodospirillaceae bacterium]